MDFTSFSERASALLDTVRRRALGAAAHVTRYSQEQSNARTLAIVAVVFFGASAFYLGFVAPPADFPVERLVIVPENATLREAAVALKVQRAIRSENAFVLTQRLWGREASVHAGDYFFKRPRTLFGVGRAVGLGAYGLEPIRFRVAEGTMVKEIAEALAERFQRFDEEHFLAEALPLEGALFPDTYFFLPNATEDTILAAMTRNFDGHIEPLLEEIEAFGKNLDEVLIMASLLEREASTTYDRRMIAGVLWSRLEQDMLLQVDAAFLYTLGKATFDLTLDDLQSDSPYNTYRYKGLPPTPIGNPSLDSIQAAITPVEHDYLFYLADHSGVTYYSETYEEHLRKKRIHLGG